MLAAANKFRKFCFLTCVTLDTLEGGDGAIGSPLRRSEVEAPVPFCLLRATVTIKESSIFTVVTFVGG